MASHPPNDRWSAGFSRVRQPTNLRWRATTRIASSRNNSPWGDLGRIASPTLDSCFEIPLFFVHLGASQRSILRDMEDQVRHWKACRELGTSKVHTANVADYLKVWDLREGWRPGGGYDRSKELTFAEVGRRLRSGSISTVANRYRSAFEMITGHPFKPDLRLRRALYGAALRSQGGRDRRTGQGLHR